MEKREAGGEGHEAREHLPLGASMNRWGMITGVLGAGVDFPPRKFPTEA